MSLRVLVPALAGLSLLTVPIAAQAAPVERQSAPAAQENELMGGSFLWLILAVAAVVAAVLIFDGKDDPVSP